MEEGPIEIPILAGDIFLACDVTGDDRYGAPPLLARWNALQGWASLPATLLPTSWPSSSCDAHFTCGSADVTSEGSLKYLVLDLELAIDQLLGHAMVFHIEKTFTARNIGEGTSFHYQEPPRALLHHSVLFDTADAYSGRLKRVRLYGAQRWQNAP